MEFGRPSSALGFRTFPSSCSAKSKLLLRTSSMPPASKAFALALSIFFVLFSVGVTSRSANLADRPCSDQSGVVRPCTVNCLLPDPVCGKNGVTYPCGCPDAACAGVCVVKRGPC